MKSPNITSRTVLIDRLIGINWLSINFNAQPKFLSLVMQICGASRAQSKVAHMRFGSDEMKTDINKSRAKTEQTSKCWSSTTIKKNIQHRKTHFSIDFLYASQPVKNKNKKRRAWRKKGQCPVRWGSSKMCVCMCVYIQTERRERRRRFSFFSCPISDIREHVLLMTAELHRKPKSKEFPYRQSHIQLTD